MGSNGSKTGVIPKDELSEGSLPSTPILTPKMNKLIEENIDPRSPTANILRTPIQFDALCDKIENLNETPVKVMLGIDPRSPTTDFDRTPIYVSAEQSLPKLRNKNFDNVLRGVQTNAKLRQKFKSNNEQQEGNNVVPPKLLESSPISTNRDAYKRKSFVGLLETNIDFTETDLDTVINNKSFNKSNTKDNSTITEISTPKQDKIIVNRLLDVVKTENIDPRSPTTDFVRTPIQIVKKIGEIDINEKQQLESEGESLDCSTLIIKDSNNLGMKLEENLYERFVEESVEDSKSTTPSDKITTEVQTSVSDIGIQTTEILEEIEPKTNILADAAVQTSCILGSEETFDQSSDIKSIQQSVVVNSTENEIEIPICLTPKRYNNTPTKSVINVTAHVKDFDKKLTNLIYHDETDLNVLPTVIKVKDNSRTPLGIRNGNTINEPRKSLSKLKVSDKPRHSLSKIPVFRDKNGKKIVCENTPPTSKNPRQVGKPRKSHWDGDNTLVI